jgi:hypothetical protein
LVGGSTKEKEEKVKLDKYYVAINTLDKNDWHLKQKPAASLGIKKRTQPEQWQKVGQFDQVGNDVRSITKLFRNT